MEVVSRMGEAMGLTWIERSHHGWALLREMCFAKSKAMIKGAHPRCIMAVDDA